MGGAGWLACLLAWLLQGCSLFAAQLDCEAATLHGSPSTQTAVPLPAALCCAVRAVVDAGGRVQGPDFVLNNEGNFMIGMSRRVCCRFFFLTPTLSSPPLSLLLPAACPCLVGRLQAGALRLGMTACSATQRASARAGST